MYNIEAEGRRTYIAGLVELYFPNTQKSRVRPQHHKKTRDKGEGESTL